MTVVRIKLVSPNYNDLEAVSGQIIDIAKTAGVKFVGPVPLPTKRLRVATRKSPCGGGTETWQKHELRLHKRLIDVHADDSTLSRVMRVQVPGSVNLSLEMKQ